LGIRGAKEKAWQKEKRRKECFALCGARGGLCALHPTHFLKKVRQKRFRKVCANNKCIFKNKNFMFGALQINENSFCKTFRKEFRL
jgi:hypothetical protein